MFDLISYFSIELWSKQVKLTLLYYDELSLASSANIVLNVDTKWVRLSIHVLQRVRSRYTVPQPHWLTKAGSDNNLGAHRLMLTWTLSFPFRSRMARSVKLDYPGRYALLQDSSSSFALVITDGPCTLSSPLNSAQQGAVGAHHREVCPQDADRSLMNTLLGDELRIPTPSRRWWVGKTKYLNLLY